MRNMRKMLLLAATLCACAIIPASASAHGHTVALPQVTSSFGVTIFVRDAQKVVHRHYHTPQLRPQPWHRDFQHHAPGWRGHKPWPPGRQHFHRPWWDHGRGFDGPGRPLVKDGDRRHRLHRPGPDRRPAVRHQARHGRPFVPGPHEDRRRR